MPRRSMDQEIAAAERLLEGPRAIPLAGEPQPTLLVPDSDADCVGRARGAIVGHGHLEARVSVHRDRVRRVRYVLDVRLAVEGGLARGVVCSERGHGVPLDLVGLGAAADDRVDVPLEVGVRLVVLHVEPEVGLLALRRRDLAAGGTVDEKAPTRDEVVQRLRDGHRRVVSARITRVAPTWLPDLDPDRERAAVGVSYVRGPIAGGGPDLRVSGVDE